MEASVGRMVSELRSKASELQLQLQPFLTRGYVTLPELAGVLQVGNPNGFDLQQWFAFRSMGGTPSSGSHGMRNTFRSGFKHSCR